MWGIFFVALSAWMLAMSTIRFREGNNVAGWLNLVLSAVDAAVAARDFV